MFVIVAVISTAALVGIAVWARPDAIPAYFGKLIPKRQLLFSSRKTDQDHPRLEIGDSGAIFIWAGKSGEPIFNFSNDNSLTVEKIFEKLKVSTTIRDKSGAVVAEIIRNQWRVSPPHTFDRTTRMMLWRCEGPMEMLCSR